MKKHLNYTLRSCPICHGAGTIKDGYGYLCICPHCAGRGETEDDVEPWWETLAATASGIILFVVFAIACFAIL